MSYLNIVLAVIIVVMLSLISYAYHFIDQKFGYRAQHRQGPNRSTRMGWGQQLVDFRKFSAKEAHVGRAGGALFFIGVAIYCMLPYVFFVLLLNPVSDLRGGYGGFFSLFLIVAFATAVDSLFLYSFEDNQFRIQAKRGLLLKIVGVSTLLLSCIPSLIHFGPEIVQGYREGASADYFMFRNPFGLLAAICAFCSFFFILPSKPIGQSIDFAFSGLTHFFYQSAKDLWVVALFSLWVGVFFGGWVGVGVSNLEFLLYFFKLALVLVLFVWVRKTLPTLRIRDSVGFGLKRLLPLACIATIGEILWVAILG